MIIEMGSNQFKATL